MLMKTITRYVVVTLSLFLSATVANAGVFSVTTAQMDAIDNPGTMPIGVPAISMINAPTTIINSNPAVDYSYTTDGSTNTSAGFTPDYHFLGSAGTTPATGPTWTFAALSSDYYLYPTTDHVPLPNEALESSLWGSNNGGSTWILGTVVEVYEQGWDPAGVPDVARLDGYLLACQYDLRSGRSNTGSSRIASAALFLRRWRLRDRRCDAGP
jgi:hypothetical protein